jgi:hypothetical protein
MSTIPCNLLKHLQGVVRIKYQYKPKKQCPMAQFEIYWDDLTDEAKERLSDLNHGNVDLTPLAVIEVEDVEEIDES